MFMQTLSLALTARGLGSCVEVSITGYPELIRAQLDITAELSILCGVAVGYPDPNFAANKLHFRREPIGKNAVFLDTSAGERTRTVGQEDKGTFKSSRPNQPLQQTGLA
jgi:hypothetical protein